MLSVFDYVGCSKSLRAQRLHWVEFGGAPGRQPDGEAKYRANAAAPEYVVRRDAGDVRGLPPYVALDNYDLYSSWLGLAHRPFVPAPLRANPVLNDNLPEVVPVSQLQNLDLARGLTLERVRDRATLLRSFDAVERRLDNARGSLEAVDDPI